MYRVGLIGPESTGKSTLAKFLAKRYQGILIPEYAREYVAALDRPYTYEDVCAIAQEQIKQLKNAEDGLYFYDTELVLTKVWFDVVYHQIPDWLEEAIVRYPMDVYLLTYPDVTWVQDPTRENGSDARRKELYDRYQQEIEKLNIPYYIIKH